MKEKRIRLIVYAELVLFIVLLLLTVFTRVRVSIDKEYSDKNHVALYLFEYDRLPDNYIYKAQRYDGFMQDGKYIGGDTFRYEGYITSYTDNTTLRECDISYDISSNTRGTNRLVYAIDDNGDVLEVFYTSTHYGEAGSPAFTKITPFGINIVSNISAIILVCINIFNFTIVIIKRKDQDIIIDNIGIALKNVFRRRKEITNL